ncbi:MAG: DUF1501 domain-containing protein [Verrucomicrobiae bacterium]|nr:DUF1501 domain-containing protein [Verrucomicrobiae bacterium]
MDSRLLQASSRRDWLRQAGCGFGSIALAGIASRLQAASGGLEVPSALTHTPRVKRIIFVFMQGGPSHVDTFDLKPELAKWDGKKATFNNPRTRQVEDHLVMKSLWDFRQHGQCGRQVSTLFPETAKHVDDLCFLHGMHTEGVAHGPATLFLHTGATNLVRPSVGAWISYGLGTENENLPAFVTINPPANKGGPRNYGNAFLPAMHQGTVLGSPGDRNAVPRLHNLESPLAPEARRRQFEFLNGLDRLQANEPDPNFEGAIESLELAWRMQSHAAGIVDLDRESVATRELYGIGKKPTDAFGRQCLAARQLAEAGVRYIQISHCDNGATPVWDQHSNMPKHEELAAEVDRPIAGLLADLKRRGLLEDTLVWWGGEFGRTPFTQNKNGRDHNPRGFTTWLAGGGVKPGFAHGETDELGFAAVRGKVHMHDLHATLLHLLGVDHEKLTYRLAGRDFRLTDVAGHVVNEILA